MSQPIAERPRHDTQGPFHLTGHLVRAENGTPLAVVCSTGLTETTVHANGVMFAASSTMLAALEHVLDRPYLDEELRAIVEDAVSRAIPEDRGTAGAYTAGSGF